MSQRQAIVPRLMTKTEAASYCGMSPAVFDRLCPVRPLRFSERMVKFDVEKINDWIEQAQSPAKHTRELSLIEEFDRVSKR